MKIIRLTQGKVAIVDDCDYERLVSMGSWYYHDGYAKREGNVRMHRVILDAPVGTYVEHKDGDKLDNRRSNLRLCVAVCGVNRGPNANSRTGIKGVTYHRHKAKWRAVIKLDGRQITLGYFDHAADAAAAYDQAALKHFEGAWTNDIDPYGFDLEQFNRLVLATARLK